MKTCFKCGDSKPLTGFYTHPRMADGHLNKCKVCARIDSNARRDSNLEKVREYDRRRATAPERISVNVERTRHYRRANPQKAHAHLAVARALRSGRLVRQPCSVCGCEKSEAHHPDYSNPLDVMWLCSLHHKEQHKRERMDLVLKMEVRSMSYHPTVEQAARVGTMLARLDDPRELARIAGIGSKSTGINRADLPSKETIRRYTIGYAANVRSVGNYIKKAGKDGRPLRMTDADLANVKTMAELGWYARDIAEAIGFSPDAVSKYCAKVGIPLRKMGHAERSAIGAKASAEARAARAQKKAA